MRRAVLHRESFRRLGGVVRQSRASNPQPEGPLGDLPKIVEKMGAADVDSVLRLIAQQARAVTGASVAAIALGSGEEFFCRATAGENAPPIRARIRSDSGLTGECIRRRVTLRCDDSETDHRVDTEACRELQVRSLAVVPVRLGSELGGVVEVFSNRVAAFSDTHLAILERMAELIAAVCRRAATLIMAAASDSAGVVEPPTPPASAFTHTTAGTTAAVAAVTRGKEAAAIASERVFAALESIRARAAANATVRKSWPIAVVLVLLLIVSISFMISRGPAPKSPEVAKQAVSESQPLPQPVAKQTPAAAPVTSQPAIATPLVAASKPTAARSVQQPQPEQQPAEVTVLKVTPGTRAPAAETHAASAEAPAPEFGNVAVVAAAPVGVWAAPVGTPRLAAAPVRAPVSSGVVPGRLLRRVNPYYPVQAREARIGGAVVLDVLIQKDGKVGKVKIVSGHPLLAQAAARAVKDWVYEPFRLNGEPIEAQTQVTVKFNQ